MFQNFQLLDVRREIPVTQIQFLPQFLHQHEVEVVTEFAKKFEYVEGSIMGHQGAQDFAYRQSQIKWLLWNDNNWWLYTKVMDKVRELNDLIWRFDLYGINEYIQYTEYLSSESSKGHYEWHMDMAHQGMASNRKLSFECILEDDYDGGEFSMLLGPSEHKVRLNKGDAVIYPSFLMSKVYPVRAGRRTSIVSWISGPSFK